MGCYAGNVVSHFLTGVSLPHYQAVAESQDNITGGSSFKIVDPSGTASPGHDTVTGILELLFNEEVEEVTNATITASFMGSN